MMRSLIIAMPLAAACLVAGCASPDVTMPPRRVDVDDESMDGGISSQDIRTVAARMCPAILAAPEVANGTPPVRIAVAETKNSSRFFIDRNVFTKRLVLELNRYGGGQVRFVNGNELVQAKRAEMAGDRQDGDVRRQVREVAKAIAASPVFAGRTDPAKVAVLPASDDEKNDAGDGTVSALLREEVLAAAGGRILFLMPGEKDGADYWLVGRAAGEKLNVMVVRPQDKLSVFERSIAIGKKVRGMAGNASLVLSGEISALSQASNGASSDYVLLTFELVDPASNETVWQDGYEVKRVSRAGIVYR